MRTLRLLAVLLALATPAYAVTSLQQVNTTSPQAIQNKALDSTNTLTGVTVISPVMSGIITGNYSFGGNAILLNPTFNNPVISGTVTGTYTLAGTVTLTSPTLNTPVIVTPTLSGGGVLGGTYTGTYTLAGTGTLSSLALVTPSITSPVISGTLSGTYTLGGTPTIADTVFRVSGSADATKKLAFEVDGNTASTTRTVTFPDANLTLPAVTAAGDTLVASASGVLTKLAVGAGGTIPMARAADPNKLAYVAALNKVIYGLTYGNNAGDATNDLDIAAGGAMDATGAYWITLGALTKQSDAAFAAGTNAGCLDTGAVGNSDYYLWAIARSDIGGVDVLCSLSSTAPSMPAAFDFKRLFGWFKRVGGTVVALTTYEAAGGALGFKWTTPTLDIDLANTLTTSRRTDALKVPLNFSVLANIRVNIDDAAVFSVLLCDPAETDAAVSSTAAPLANVRSHVAGTPGLAQLQITTSAAGLIAARASLATIDSYKVLTLGFVWDRRN